MVLFYAGPGDKISLFEKETKNIIKYWIKERSSISLQSHEEHVESNPQMHSRKMDVISAIPSRRQGVLATTKAAQGPTNYGTPMYVVWVLQEESQQKGASKKVSRQTNCHKRKRAQNGGKKAAVALTNGLELSTLENKGPLSLRIIVRPNVCFQWLLEVPPSLGWKYRCSLISQASAFSGLENGISFFLSGAVWKMP